MERVTKVTVSSPIEREAGNLVLGPLNSLIAVALAWIGMIVFCREVYVPVLTKLIVFLQRSFFP